MGMFGLEKNPWALHLHGHAGIWIVTTCLMYMYKDYVKWSESVSRSAVSNSLWPHGPLSMEFSRQEYWNGWPFPSPVHASGKWKWIRSVTSDSYRPHGLQPTRLFCPWDFPGKSTGVGCHCLESCNSSHMEYFWTHCHLQVSFSLSLTHT